MKSKSSLFALIGSVLIMGSTVLPTFAQTYPTPRQDEKKGKWGYVDANDKWVVKPKYESAGEYLTLPDGTTAAAVKNDGKSGYIDLQGKPLGAGIVFEQIDSISPAKAVVRLKDKYGIVDWNMAYLLKPDFAQVDYSDPGYYRVQKGNQWGLYDSEKSQIIIEPKYQEIVAPVTVEGIALVQARKDNGMWGLLGLDGREIYPFKAQEMTPMPSLDLIMIAENNTGHLLFFPKENTSLRFALDRIQRTGPFSIITGDVEAPKMNNPVERRLYTTYTDNGHVKTIMTDDGRVLCNNQNATVESINNLYLVDAGKGEKTLYSSDATEIASGLKGSPKAVGDWWLFSNKIVNSGGEAYPLTVEEGLTLVEKEKDGKKLLYVFNDGKLSPEGYDTVKGFMTDFISDTYTISRDGKYGTLCDGKEILPCIYDEKVEMLFNPRLLEVTKDGKKGLFDFDGKEVMPVEYDSFYSLWESHFLANKDGKVGFYKTDGTEVVPLGKYDEITVPGAYIQVKADGKIGILATNGDELIAPKYTEVAPIDGLDDYLWVAENNLWGVVNPDLKEIVPCIYGDTDLATESFGFVGKKGKTETLYDFDGAIIPKKREVIVKNQYLEHNVYDSNGNKGLKLHFDINTRFLNEDGEEVYVEAAVYLKNGKPAPKKGGGQVMHHYWIKPTYRMSTFSDHWVTIPYAQFVQGKGAQDYYIKLKFQDETGKTLPVTGNDKITFTLTR